MLQSVIRNLVDSVDEEDRITQRNKLEDDLTIASERLDALVQGVEERREGGRGRGRGEEEGGTKEEYCMLCGSWIKFSLLLEHREKLHGTLDTFEKVDVKIRGKFIFPSHSPSCPLLQSTQRGQRASSYV